MRQTSSTRRSRPTYDNDLGDSLTPNYGFTRKRTITKLSQKAAGGAPYTRDTQNTGHRFAFSWIDRNYACVQRVKQFSEQFEDGYFTIIDWDGGPQGEGRHFVGRFVTEVIPVETDFNKWSILNAEFEEVPTVPMVQYPGDWDNDAIWHYASNDFGQPKAATYLAANAGLWALTPRPGMLQGAGAASPGASLDTAGALGDWAQYEYHGYGFQLFMLAGPDGGRFTISLDGVELVNPLPIPSIPGGAFVPNTTFDSYAVAPLNPALILTWPKAPLDFHRVMVTALAQKNAASTGTNVRWWALKVMR